MARILSRWLVAPLVAAAIGSTTVAAAASLGLSSEGLAAGSSSVQNCDPNGLTTAYTVKLGNVTAVVVTDIAAACESGDLSLVLVDGTGAVLATGGPVPITPGPVTVPTSASPAASDVEGVYIVVEGL